MSIALRLRIREARAPEEIAGEVARWATETLGFEHATILFDEVPSLIKEEAWTRDASPHMATLNLSHAIAAPLRDVDGSIGIVVAGRREGGRDWPSDAPSLLVDALPDIALALRNRILRTQLSQQHSREHAENERLVRELRKRNEEMLDDLEQARELQSAVLGVAKPPAIEGIATQIIYRPHDAVSGDLHDVFFDASSKRLRVFLADTTGHGVRAGLATMLLKAEYEAIKRLANNPTDVLVQLNTRIAETYRPNSLTMTAICYDLDVTTGALRYTTAAHPSAIVRTHADGGTTTRELTSGGSFIGVVREASLNEGTAELAIGDTIYVYTDGVSEASSASGELFGEKRICDLLASGGDARALVKAVEKFTRPLGFNDDVAIVGVTRIETRV